MTADGIYRPQNSIWYQWLVGESNTVTAETGHATVYITDEGQDNSIYVFTGKSDRESLGNTASWISDKRRRVDKILVCQS